MRLLSSDGLAWCLLASTVSAWSSSSPLSKSLMTVTRRSTTLLGSTNDESASQQGLDSRCVGVGGGRRKMLTTGCGLLLGGILATEAASAEEEEDFASIAERAAKISKAIEAEEPKVSKPSGNADTRTAYDFTLPVAGEQVTFKEFVKQEFGEEGGDAKVKGILVVNIKQDDPIARKNIPEFISLAAKYGRQGEFVVVCSPTDQGYFEPDTSALIRLKLASEYGYGINPSTTLTDKVNLLGSGAHPFWRWLEGTCRTPAGLGRVEANFEKFLLDGRTGLPLRRYPRKFAPFDMKDDIEAVMAGKPLPPVGAKYLEDWRQAERDAERDTYRFQKGLNVFDQ